MFKSVPTICLIALWLALGAGQVQAKLVIDVTARTEVGQGRAAVELEVANRGDEPALNLKAEAVFQGQRARSESLPSLAPGNRRSLHLTLPLPDDGPGRYPAPVYVRFSDGGGRGYTALSAAEMVVGQDRVSPLIIEADRAVVAGRGELPIRLLNPTGEEIEAAVSLYLSPELAVEADRFDLTLPPKGSARAVFELTNRTGRIGAVYPVLIVVEHRDGGHHAAKSMWQSLTLADSNPFRRYLWWWVVACLILVVAAGAAQLRRRRSR